MGDQSQSFRFQALFESALLDYQSQTGTILVNHPLAQQLLNCDSIPSVTAVLQTQVRAFSEFPGGDDKIMQLLNHVVLVLHPLSTSTALGAVMIGMVVRQMALISVTRL